MNTIKLEVGKSYKSRDGKEVVKIVAIVDEFDFGDGIIYCFVSDDGAYYSKEGVSEGSRASCLITEYFPPNINREKSYTIAELKAMSPTELKKLISEK